MTEIIKFRIEMPIKYDNIEVGHTVHLCDIEGRCAEDLVYFPCRVIDIIDRQLNPDSAEQVIITGRAIEPESLSYRYGMVIKDPRQ